MKTWVSRAELLQVPGFLGEFGDDDFILTLEGFSSYYPAPCRGTGGGVCMRDLVGPTGVLLLILAAAFGLRVVAACVVDQRAQAAGEICLIPGDADGYWELGGKLARGETYSLYSPPRYVLRMPGFPAVLAVSQFVFGEATLPARVLLAGIGTLCCALAYLLGRELVNDAVGLMAAAATSVTPVYVGFSVLFLSEMSFAAAMLLSLWLFVRLVKALRAKTPFWGLAIGTGLAIALATYLRPTWLLVAPMAGMVLVVIAPWVPRNWLAAGGILAALFVAMTPWVIRNWMVTSHPVVTTLWSGPSLYDGLHAGASGDSNMQFIETDHLMGRMSEYEMNREYSRRAWAFVRENPVGTLQLAAVKQIRYWNPLPNGAQFSDWKLQLLTACGTIPLYLFALCGVWRHRSNWLLLLCTLGPLLYFAGLHLLFVGSIRYRLPAEFPLWVLAAAGAVHPLFFPPRQS